MLGGQGADFLRGIAFLEHGICGFTKMILRDRRSTSHDLASLFRGMRSALDTWRNGKIAIRIGTAPPALHSTSHFSRKPGRIASVFNVANAKYCLPEFLRFGGVDFHFVTSLAGLLRFGRANFHL